MLNRSVEALDGGFREKLEKMLLDLGRRWSVLGYKPMVVETKRALATQMAYYSRGRCPVEVVKEFFKAAGLWSLTDKEAGQTVTWTMESKHLVGKAADVVPSKDGKTPDWSAPAAVWNEMGQAAKTHGLVWGGGWQKRDNPHVEV